MAYETPGNGRLAALSYSFNFISIIAYWLAHDLAGRLRAEFVNVSFFSVSLMIVQHKQRLI